MEIPPSASANASAGAAPSPAKPKRVLAVQHKTMVRGTRASEMRAEKAAAAAAAAASASAAKSSSGSSTPIPSAPSTARSSLAHLPPNIALSATLPVPPVKSAAGSASPSGTSAVPSLSQTASSAALKSKGVGVKKAILKPRYATMKPSVSAALTAAAASSSASHPVLLTHANSGKLASGTISNRLTAPTASSAAKTAPGMHGAPGAHADSAKTPLTLEPPQHVVLSDANPSPTALGPSASASSHSAPHAAPPAAAATATTDKLAVPPLTLAPSTSSPKLRPSSIAPRVAHGTASTGVPPRHSTSRNSRLPSANAHAASSSAAAASSSAAIAASSRLSATEREVLADIGIIQDWLSSIKASKRSNLMNFKETICAMKKTIFTPQQVTRARKAAGTTTSTAAAAGTKSGSSSIKKTAAAKSTLTAAQRAAAAAANALLSPLQRKLVRLSATPLMTHFDFSSGDLAALTVPPAAAAADHSDADAVSSASALPARASPPLLEGLAREADDDSDYGDDFDPAAHADGSPSGGGGGGGGGDDDDDFDSKLSSFLRKTTKRDEDFIRDSTLSGQGQFAHVSSVVFENGRWIPKSESQHAGGGGAAASSKSILGVASASAATDLDDEAQWGSETEQTAADDDEDNALDHIPDFSSSRAMDNDDPTSNSPSSVSQKQAAYRPGSGMGTITASSRMRSSSNSQSAKRTSTRTGTLSRTSRATSSAISPAFDDTSDAVSVSGHVSMSGRSDSPSHLTSFGGEATSPPATASSKTFPASSPSSVSVSARQARQDDLLDDLDAIPDFDSEPPSAADHKIVAPQPTTPSHTKANSAIVAPFPFATQGQSQSGSHLALSPASHQKSRSIGFIPAATVNAVAPTLPPTVITVQSWTKNSAAPFVPVTTAAPAPTSAAPTAAAPPSSTLLKKSVAADNDFPDDLDGLDDEDDDQPVHAADSRPASLLKKPSLISTASSGGSKMQTFTSMPVTGSKAPGHVLTSSASLDDDDALELQLESRAMLSPASTTRSTLRSGMGGSGLDSEPDSASVNGPSSSSSGPVNHSSRISLFSKALVKGSSHAEDDFPSDLDDLSDTEFEDEDRAAILAASAPTAAIAASLGKAARDLNEFALTPALQATFSASEDAHHAALMGKLSAFTSPEPAAAPLHAHVLALLRRDDAITPSLRAAYASSDLFARQFQSSCTALLAEAAAGAKAMHAARRHTYAGAKLVVPSGAHQRGRSESGAESAATGEDAPKAQKQ